MIQHHPITLRKTGVTTIKVGRCGDWPRRPLSLRPNLTLYIYSVTFVRGVCLIAHHICAFLVVRNFPKVRALKSLWPHGISLLWFCNLVCCRIDVMAAPRYMQYNSPIRLLAQVFSITSFERLIQSPYQSRFKDRFWGCTFSIYICDPAFQTWQIWRVSKFLKL